jgi:hypothetical protein
MADRPLSDTEVHDLLHAAMSLMLNKTVMTPAAIRNLEVLQNALVIMSKTEEQLRNEFEP